MHGRPVIPINLGDARHFRVFGADSMFGEVLSALGLANAWTEETSYSAMAPVGLEALARVPDAWIVMIPPLPPERIASCSDQRLLERAARRARGPRADARLDQPFGALPAARRFARLLAEALPMQRNG